MGLFLIIFGAIYVGILWWFAYETWKALNIAVFFIGGGVLLLLVLGLTTRF